MTFGENYIKMNEKLFLGSTEGVAMIENMMEHIARVTNTDPIEVRILNMDADIKKTLVPMIEEIKKTSDYLNRLQAVKKFNEVIMLKCV